MIPFLIIPVNPRLRRTFAYDAVTIQTLLICILAALVYDAGAFMAGTIAIYDLQILSRRLGGIVVGMNLVCERKAQQSQYELKPIDHRVGMGRTCHRPS